MYEDIINKLAKNSRDELSDIIAKLNERSRLVIALKYDEELSNKEISKVIGAPEDKTIEYIEYAVKKILTHPPFNKYVERVELYEVIEAVKFITPELIQYLKGKENDLENLPPEIFEELIAELLCQRGFSDVKHVGRDIATSADIYAAYNIDAIGEQVKYFVEVKRWKDKVGIQVINQVYGAMLIEQPDFGWTAAMLVSLSGYKEFKKIDRHMLDKRNVILKDRNDISLWIDEYIPNKDGLWLPKGALLIE